MHVFVTGATGLVGRALCQALLARNPQPTPDDVKAILSKVGPTIGSQSQPRTDAAQNSPAWTHLTMPRGQFKRIGSTRTERGTSAGSRPAAWKRSFP